MKRRCSTGVRPRTLAAIQGGKLSALLSRRLGRGGGTSLPGLVANRLDPHVVGAVTRQLGYGSIVVTGTNGKTTTARMLAGIAGAAGLRSLHNRSGSNLIRGLAATAVAATDALGRVRCAGKTLGVFEVDEATLALALPELSPRAVLFTNLFRDQLDRYGEVDSIAALWRRALTRLDGDVHVVLNADDPSVAGLAAQAQGPVTFYGVDDERLATAAEHAADSRWCARCGCEYRYGALFFGHLGVWDCPGCGAMRPVRQVSARRLQLAADGPTLLDVETPVGRLGLELPLGGLYNAYNALAACAGALALGLPLEAVRSGLGKIEAAFGRQEVLQIAGRRVQVLLCKNPAGANQVLRYLLAGPPEKCLLIVLNDGIADGRDVSWIWDVDYELLAGRARHIVVSGRRAADMALRLKYAGLGEALAIEPDQGRAIDRALASTPRGGCLYALPTYTAMLGLRDRLAQLAGETRFWEQ